VCFIFPTTSARKIFLAGKYLTSVLTGFINLPNIVTDLINALPGNRSVNTVQHATIDEAVFPMSSAPSSGGTTGLCNPFLSNVSVNISAYRTVL
jgi:hypothetical protein